MSAYSKGASSPGAGFPRARSGPAELFITLQLAARQVEPQGSPEAHAPRGEMKTYALWKFNMPSLPLPEPLLSLNCALDSPYIWL